MSATGQDAWNSRKRKFQCVPGEQLACVQSEGRGPVAIFVHGFSDSSRSFSLMEEFLPDIDFFALDLPGHGGNGVPAGGFGIGNLASMLAAFIAGVAHEPPLLVGHSLGAIIAIHMLARNPKIARAAILISPSLRPGSDSRLASWIDQISGRPSSTDPFFDYWHGTAKPVPVGFINHVRTEAAALEPTVWRGVFHEFRRADLTEDARRIKCPLITVCGDQDVLFDGSHQRLAVNCLNPVAHFLMKGLGHNPHWEAPETVANLVNRFAKVRDLQPARP